MNGYAATAETDVGQTVSYVYFCLCLRLNTQKLHRCCSQTWIRLLPQPTGFTFSKLFALVRTHTVVVNSGSVYNSGNTASVYLMCFHSCAALVPNRCVCFTPNKKHCQASFFLSCLISFSNHILQPQSQNLSAFVCQWASMLKKAETLSFCFNPCLSVMVKYFLYSESSFLQSYSSTAKHFFSEQPWLFWWKL